MPRVSVIIPAYNQGCFLREAIDSVLAQTYQDFEVLVVDDGSTDNTAAVALAVRDPRVSYLWQENRGVSAARNLGLRASQGEYIAFLDADDWYLPHKLEVQVRALDDQPDVGLSSGGWVYVDEQGEVLREVRFWRSAPVLAVRALFFDCPIRTCSVLIRKLNLEQVGGFDEELRLVQDYDLFLRLAIAGCRMVWVESVVSCYRQHPGQRTRDRTRQTQAIATVLTKIFSDPGLPPELQGLRDQALAHAYLRGAFGEYRSERIPEAQADLQRAVDLDPRLMDHGGREILAFLAAYAGSLPGEDSAGYIRAVLGNLPQWAGALRRHERQLVADAAMAPVFEAYREREWPSVRRAILRAAVGEPRGLLNHGVQSIALEAFFGGALAGCARGIARRLGAAGVSS